MNDRAECRTCLGLFNDDDVVSVRTRLGDQKNVLEAIEEVASIEANESDWFPKQICQKCFQSLESAVSFRQQVIDSHIVLKKRFQCNNDMKDPLFINCKGDRGEINEDANTDSLKLEVKEEEIEGAEKNCELTQPHSPLEKDEKDEGSSSDWNNFSNVNNSSDDDFRKPTRRLIKKRKTLRRPVKEVSDTSSSDSDASDSDVPLEELRKEISTLEPNTAPRVKKKRRKNDNAEGPRLCPICGKLFKARQNFNSHMTTVHRKKPDKPDKITCLCPDCGRVITGTRQNFVAHRRYHHSDKAQVKKRFTCDVCPRKFYREKNLIIHQRIHKGEKGYVCELCPDKSYTQIGGLILHRRKVHLKKPTCTCNYCGKQFYEKHYLETHIRQWHTGERPFSCEICGKAFSCNGTLLRHRKDSHGEKQPCPKCGKMYTEGELRKHLKRHKIREEGIKRKKYTCEYCGTEMNFTSRKRHLLKQHGIMLRGRGENAERVPITRADAM